MPIGFEALPKDDLTGLLTYLSEADVEHHD